MWFKKELNQIGDVEKGVEITYMQKKTMYLCGFKKPNQKDT